MAAPAVSTSARMVSSAGLTAGARQLCTRPWAARRWKPLTCRTQPAAPHPRAADTSAEQGAQGAGEASSCGRRLLHAAAAGDGAAVREVLAQHGTSAEELAAALDAALSRLERRGGEGAAPAAAPCDDAAAAALWGTLRAHGRLADAATDDMLWLAARVDDATAVDELLDRGPAPAAADAALWAAAARGAGAAVELLAPHASAAAVDDALLDLARRGAASSLPPESLERDAMDALAGRASDAALDQALRLALAAGDAGAARFLEGWGAAPACSAGGLAAERGAAERLAAALARQLAWAERRAAELRRELREARRRGAELGGVPRSATEGGGGGGGGAGA
eukprot:scaffold4.g5030.t1